MSHHIPVMSGGKAVEFKRHSFPDVETKVLTLLSFDVPLFLHQHSLMLFLFTIQFMSLDTKK